MPIAMRNPGSENKSKMEKRNKSANKPIEKQANKRTILSMIVVLQTKIIDIPMVKLTIEQKQSFGLSNLCFVILWHRN